MCIRDRPLFFFLAFFAIDIGRVILFSNILQDATFVAARTGAQIGGAGDPASGASWSSFESTLAGEGILDPSIATNFTVLSGQTCSVADPFVRISVQYPVTFITPGLGALIDNPALTSNPWTISASAVARCEVVP